MMTAYAVQCRDGHVRIIHAETQEEACQKMARSPRRLTPDPVHIVPTMLEAWTEAPQHTQPEVALVFELDWEALLRMRAAGVVELRDA